MAMDIRPNPLRDNSLQENSGGKMSDEWKMRIIIIGIIIVVLALVGIVWYVSGAPGASEGVKRSIGKLPVAGDRALSNNLGNNRNGLSFGTPAPQTNSGAESPLSGIACANANRRPIAVMIGSDPINRPDSGFSLADVVVEMPALTSNVTRLMAVFQCNEPREIGSIRSARHDYLFLAKGMDAIITHWGGSYWALNMIKNESKVYDSISALGTGNQAFFRKSNLPAPFNGFTSYARVWDAAIKAGYHTTDRAVPYTHVDGAPVEVRGAGGTLDIGWPGSMRTRYVYNKEKNAYERYWAGVRHIDSLDNNSVDPKVLAVVYTNQRLANGPGGYNDVDVEGSGKAEIYQNGQMIPATWSKSVIDKQDPLHFKDATGKEIPFVRGQLWISIVDSGTTVRWTPGGSAPAELQTGETPANLGG
jgi:hypothetical protein